ncbi:hypothetical protein ILP97_03885 [Amycolatopsis sp. H6(2020)]|nr:hypothetical protein [Amycolatopsis sp. H6(2020)]
MLHARRADVGELGEQRVQCLFGVGQPREHRCHQHRTAFALHLRPGAREWFGRWLAGTHPELVPRYRELYARGSYVRKAYREGLAARVGPLLRRHGLDRKSGFEARGPELPAAEAAPAEQLRLL